MIKSYASKEMVIKRKQNIHDDLCEKKKSVSQSVKTKIKRKPTNQPTRLIDLKSVYFLFN